MKFAMGTDEEQAWKFNMRDIFICLKFRNLGTVRNLEVISRDHCVWEFLRRVNYVQTEFSDLCICYYASFASLCIHNLASQVKVNLSLHFNWAPRCESICGEWKYSSTHSLISALGGGEWSNSCTGFFTPRERAPVTYWIGDWVDPRAILDTVVKR